MQSNGLNRRGLINDFLEHGAFSIGNNNFDLNKADKRNVQRRSFEINANTTGSVVNVTLPNDGSKLVIKMKKDLNNVKRAFNIKAGHIEKQVNFDFQG